MELLGFDEFENETITVVQDFMNSAAIKYNKIAAGSGGKFKGSIYTVQEDVVALLSAKVKPKATKRKRDNDDDAENENEDKGRGKILVFS